MYDLLILKFDTGEGVAPDGLCVFLVVGEVICAHVSEGSAAFGVVAAEVGEHAEHYVYDCFGVIMVVEFFDAVYYSIADEGLCR